MLDKMTLLFLLLPLFLGAVEPADIEGYWLTEKGEMIAEIHRCDDDSTFCGWIRWLEDSLDKEGRLLTDSNNPIDSLQGRELLDMKLMWGFIFDENEETWDSGRIYNAENGKTYHASMQLLSSDSLKLKGSLDKRGWLGGSTIWTRAKIPQ